MQQIPFIDYPCFSEDIALEGVSYTFEFTWNARGEFWTMAIYNSEKTLVVSGIKLVLKYDLLKGRHHLAVPTGALYVIDPSEGTVKIAYQDFINTRALMLVYLTEAENVAL